MIYDASMQRINDLFVPHTAQAITCNAVAYVIPAFLQIQRFDAAFKLKAFG